MKKCSTRQCNNTTVTAILKEFIMAPKFEGNLTYLHPYY